MEFVGVGLGWLFNSILPRLWNKMQESKLKKTAIKIDIEEIRREAELLQSRLEDGYTQHEGAHKAKLLVINGQLNVLCSDTHDCIHQFLRRGCMESDTEFPDKIKIFKDDVRKLGEGTVKLMDSFNNGRLDERPCRYVPSSEFVGGCERLAELQELVHDQRGCRQEEPKVISILGFAGLGKTLLANEFYNNRLEFHHRAWVTDAGSHAEVVKNILTQIDKEGNHGEDALDLKRLCGSLHKFLQTATATEYLIVIDDMKRPEMWNAIKYAFKNAKGIVLVTTTIQQVANTCSKGINGYVYRLSPLDEYKSLELFKKGCDGNHALAAGILKKCDGLPVAIVDVADYLQSEDLLTVAGCEATSSKLGALLVQENNCKLRAMQWVIMNKYTGLPGHAIRSCLLYFCMYKQNMDAPPKRNSLIRRWQAEGFVDGKTGCQYLKTLVDCNILQPMELSTDGTTKRCRAPGIMAEYISEISKSEYFAALVSDLAERPINPIRRLYSDGDSPEIGSKISDMDLCFVLTLTISGVGSSAIMEFKKYELLAVLDLKGCENLEDKHVKHIWKLLLLKYLSLGKNVVKIPADIRNLKLLETLEMTTTKRVEVYRDVLELPNLKHLIGRFVLKNDQDESWYDSLEQNSGLETITGFVTETDKGFPELMRRMMRLRKVKLCCSYQAGEKEDPTEAIKQFIRRGTDNVTGGHGHSLSIDFTECTTLVAKCLEGPGKGSLTSLKLRGDWRPFGSAIPDLRKISGITKLCLAHTCLSWGQVLVGLTDLVALEYLKLEEEKLGDFTIKSGTLQQLRRLCLVGEKSLKDIKIQGGALPGLVSLHLIGKVIAEGVQLSDGCLRSLREITLPSAVTAETKEAWKTKSKDHPNRPAVLLIPSN